MPARKNRVDKFGVSPSSDFNPQANIVWPELSIPGTDPETDFVDLSEPGWKGPFVPGLDTMVLPEDSRLAQAFELLPMLYRS